MSSPVANSTSIARATPSLDPKETSAHSAECVSNCPAKDVAFRHSGWQSHRRRIQASMRRLELSESRRRNFDYCGSGAWVCEHPDHPGELRVLSSTCKDRWCVPCQIRRRTTIKENLREALKGQGTRMLTLTTKHGPEPLRDQITRIVGCFRALRRRHFWLERVTGGAFSIEVKYNHDRGEWHPHIHALITGSYVDQGVLSRAWKKITGDSYIVDIRRVDADQAIDYVTKYVTKPVDASVLAVDHVLDEAIEATRGIRLVATFGILRGVRLVSNDEDHDQPAWRYIARLTDVIRRAAAGDESASLLLDKVRPIVTEEARAGP